MGKSTISMAIFNSYVSLPVWTETNITFEDATLRASSRSTAVDKPARVEVQWPGVDLCNNLLSDQTGAQLLWKPQLGMGQNSVPQQLDG